MMFSLRLSILLALLPLGLVFAGDPVPGPRALVLIDKGFDAASFWQPVLALQGANVTADIAAPETGPVQAAGEDRAMDATATVSFADIKAAQYELVLIPGGESPARLAKDPRVPTFCRAFSAREKPMLAIGEGPLVLAVAGLLKGHDATGAWTIKDAIPELWRNGGCGRYVDRPLVRDGNFFTARGSADAGLLASAAVGCLQNPPLPALPITRRVVVVDAGADLKTAWAFMGSGLMAQGISVTSLPAKAFLEASSPFSLKAADFDALVILPGRQLDDLWTNDAFMRFVDGFKVAGVKPVIGINQAADSLGLMGLSGPDLLIAKGTPEEVLPQVVHEVQARTPHGPALPPAPWPNISRRAAVRADPAPAQPGRPSAILCLFPGFDPEAVGNAASVLKERRYTLTTAGPSSGPIPAWDGSSLTAISSWSTPAAVGDVIVAPGCLWPDDSSPSAKARRNWLRAQQRRGIPILLVGFDSFQFGNDPACRGLSFSAPEAVRTAFAPDCAVWSETPVTATAPRMVTARDAESVAEALGVLLPSPTPAR